MSCRLRARSNDVGNIMQAVRYGNNASGKDEHVNRDLARIEDSQSYAPRTLLPRRLESAQLSHIILLVTYQVPRSNAPSIPHH
jgi:hypothetical protein